MATKKDTGPPRLKDGFIDALGGINSDVEPDLLAANQLAFAVNVTLRGGYPTSRPGFIPRTDGLTFLDQSIRDWWNLHLFQGNHKKPFTPANDGAVSMMVCSVGGRQFTVTPSQNFTVREITPRKTTALSTAQITPPSGGTVQWLVDDASHVLINMPVEILGGHYLVTNKNNNLLALTQVDGTPGIAAPAGTPVLYLDPNGSFLPMTWYEEVEGRILIQDGQSRCIISDGFSSRRSDPAVNEVPVGTAMKYHQGRLWLAVGKEVAIGDIATTTNPLNALRFTEENTLGGSGRFRMSSDITAIVEMPALDASLGQGPIQVITRDNFNSFNLPAARDTWATLTFPFQTISVAEFGSLNQNGCTVVNGDCFYPSRIGWQTFLMARREFGEWGNTPISAEMDRVLADEPLDLRLFTSSVQFDNRLLMTMQPQRVGPTAIFNSIGTLDFQPQSGIRNKRPPIWEGIWTGIHPYQLVAGEFDEQERCFAFTNEPTGIGLWEISKNNPFDGDGGRIASWIEYPAFKFTKPFERKKLQSCKIWFADIIGQVDFILRFRVDDAACWVFWNARSRCATVNTCKTNSCYTMQQFKAGYKPHMGFSLPPDVSEEFDNHNIRFGYEWQYRLEWTGHATIKRLLTTADGDQDQVIGDEDSDED